MNYIEFQNEFLSILSDLFHKQVEINSSLLDYNLDSLDYVEIIMSIENKYNITIDDDTAESMISHCQTPKDFMNRLGKEYPDTFPTIQKERKEKLNIIKQL
jgi:acyl carrier protein